jgi:6-pyruvoyltetrahydropterin/6-carboxytetrahydropterin synthase
MPFRICKSFTVESGHMLSKHPGLCRFPHGHSRTVEIVLEADRLDDRDMVCDFKTIKLALGPYLAQFDHSIILNSADPMVKQLEPMRERVIVFENVDPTTEVLAQRIYAFLSAELKAGKTYVDDKKHEYRFPRISDGGGVRIVRVRVSETASTWAEYAE